MINKGDELANNKKNENQGYRANITNITLDDKNGFLYTKKNDNCIQPCFWKKNSNLKLHFFSQILVTVQAIQGPHSRIL